MFETIHGVSGGHFGGNLEAKFKNYKGKAEEEEQGEEAEEKKQRMGSKERSRQWRGSGGEEAEKTLCPVHVLGCSAFLNLVRSLW